MLHRSVYFTRQCKEHKRHSKHTRGCCKNVLHRSAVSLPGCARNTRDIKNTPKGVVRMCCTGLLFLYQLCKEHKRHSKHTRGCCKNVLHRSAVSLPGCARKANGIKNTPEGVVRMCCTGLLFLYQNNVLHRSAVSLTGGAKNTHGMKNIPEGVASIICIGLVLFTRQCKE